MKSGEKFFTFFTDTPIGKIQAAAKDHALRGLWFIGQKYFPIQTISWIEDSDYPVFVSLKAWLNDYFAGKDPRIDFHLTPRGTPFQQTIWELLLKIPYGETVTYGKIAGQVSASGKKGSAQAAGGAVGHNPISIIIPCHRVLGADGSLTGYAGGLDKKRFLLDLEKAKYK